MGSEPCATTHRWSPDRWREDLQTRHTWVRYEQQPSHPCRCSQPPGGAQAQPSVSRTARSSGLQPEPIGVHSPEPLSTAAAAAAAMVVCCTPTVPVGRGGDGEEDRVLGMNGTGDAGAVGVLPGVIRGRRRSITQRGEGRPRQQLMFLSFTLLLGRLPILHHCFSFTLCTCASPPPPPP